MKINHCYKTLFEGLKLNHPRNVAVVHPLLFLVRRAIFACMIVFMPNVPVLTCATLMVTCLAMLLLTLMESMWVDKAVNL